ncbi:LMBR1-like membrane protein-domain-containing protein [Talaromyces proteolyticus]|uniref:LMBR1-like membrane protein-domain-containing protein n=1 Tax=Talaromyces proteolyticus TaxID=1131652 RepID=A0AAD4PT69_9EURO|nr:LMBR1-like membrane protein-domain-containing protein [Talaromyces proteolyticus]KAH8692775.1 LMBR1-like membrane protein-domain-containing protein [Talaromyces proteolyticus]
MSWLPSNLSSAASSPTPVGSAVFLAISFFIICIIALLLLRRFLTLRATPGYIILPVFLALVLPASVVLLVPVDLTSSSRDGAGPKGVWLPDRANLVLWRITYWLIFCLTWFILPLLGEFVDSGYRDPKGRLLYSLRSNARYQLIVLGCGIVGLIYVSIQEGFDFTAIRALVMALAYMWGLIFAIYLMGHGLVSIPRSIFRKSNNANALRRIETRAPKIHDRLTDAVTELEELEGQLAQLQRRKTGTARDYEEWIEELADYSSLPDSRPAALHSVAESTAVPAIITERYLADLSRRLQRARHQKARFVDEWDRLVHSAADYQTILNSTASRKLDFGVIGSDAASPSKRGFLSPYTRYFLYINVLPVLRLVASAVFSVASFCVVWSELIKPFAPRLCIISLTIVPHPNDAGQVGFGGQIICSLWLLYMCTAALKGVNDAQVWGNRALVRRNTYGESACWYAGQVARLTVPLAYNFLTFFPEDIRGKTTFYRFLGQYIDLTSVSKEFDYFFPIFILLPVFATTFNFYARIKKIFGFGMVDEDDDDGEANPGGFGVGGWREGRALIERELIGLGSLSLTQSSVDPVRSTSSSTATAARRTAPTTSALRASERTSRTVGTTSPADAAAASPLIGGDVEDENFFQSFAHRVRNTFETTSTPRWLQGDLSGLSRPRWLSGDGAASDSTGQNNNNGILGGFFGSRNTNGHVRL